MPKIPISDRAQPMQPLEAGRSNAPAIEPAVAVSGPRATAARTQAAPGMRTPAVGRMAAAAATLPALCSRLAALLAGRSPSTVRALVDDEVVDTLYEAEELRLLLKDIGCTCSPSASKAELVGAAVQLWHGGRFDKLLETGRPGATSSASRVTTAAAVDAGADADDEWDLVAAGDADPASPPLKLPPAPSSSGAAAQAKWQTAPLPTVATSTRRPLSAGGGAVHAGAAHAGGSAPVSVAAKTKAVLSVLDAEFEAAPLLDDNAHFVDSDEVSVRLSTDDEADSDSGDELRAASTRNAAYNSRLAPDRDHSASIAGLRLPAKRKRTVLYHPFSPASTSKHRAGAACRAPSDDNPLAGSKGDASAADTEWEWATAEGAAAPRSSGATAAADSHEFDSVPVSSSEQDTGALASPCRPPVAKRPRQGKASVGGADRHARRGVPPQGGRGIAARDEGAATSYW